MKTDKKTITASEKEFLAKYRRIWMKQAEEARNRKEYKSAIEGFIIGGIGEFYKARASDKNGLLTWTKKWYREADYLIYKSLYDAIVHHLDGAKHRRPAINEVVDMLKSKDASFQKRAEMEVLRDFPKVKRLKAVLSKADTDDFWSMVENTINDALDTFGLT